MLVSCHQTRDKAHKQFFEEGGKIKSLRMTIIYGNCVHGKFNCELYLTTLVAMSEDLDFLSLLSKSPLLQFTVTLYLV
jgi:hypothetical protein